MATSVPRHAQPFEPVEDVRDRRRRRQHDRSRRRRACPWRRCSTPPTAPARTGCSPSTSTAGRGPRTGSSRANSRNGTSMTRRRATWSSGTRPIRAAEHDEPGLDTERPELLLRAWPRRRTRTARSPAACTAGRGGAAGPPRCTQEVAVRRRPTSAASGSAGSAGGVGGLRRRRTSHDDAAHRRRTWRRCRRGRRRRSPTASLLDARDAVVGERAVGEAMSDSAAVDARVGATFSSPSGSALAWGATSTTSATATARPSGDEGERRDAPSRHVRPPPGDGGDACRRAARCGGRRTRGPGASPSPTRRRAP